VAGHAFAALRGSQAGLAVVVSPMHHLAAPDLLTSAHTAYETPLGEVPIDHAALDELDELLQEEAQVSLARVTRDGEHSLEIELPFLQRVLPQGFSLLPLMVREPNAAVTRALGLALAKVLRNRPAVLVASSDLSHFYPQSIANKLDSEALRRVAAMDPQAVLDMEEEGAGFACGRGALSAVLWAVKELGANRGVILNYATSGDVTGDFSQVVGYAAAAFLKAE
jgi:AmmeMemoRadiSam system protein B